MHSHNILARSFIWVSTRSAQRLGIVTWSPPAFSRHAQMFSRSAFRIHRSEWRANNVFLPRQIWTKINERRGIIEDRRRRPGKDVYQQRRWPVKGHCIVQSPAIVRFLAPFLWEKEAYLLLYNSGAGFTTVDDVWANWDLPSRAWIGSDEAFYFLPLTAYRYYLASPLSMAKIK